MTRTVWYLRLSCRPILLSPRFIFAFLLFIFFLAFLLGLDRFTVLAYRCCGWGWLWRRHHWFSAWLVFVPLLILFTWR